MANLFCTKCGHELTADAAFCSKCGASVLQPAPAANAADKPRFDPAPKKAKPKHRLRDGLIGVVAVIILLIIIAGIVGNHGSSSTTTAATAPSRFTVSAADLSRDYHLNEVRADKDFKGQAFTVVGVVRAIKKNAFDHLYVDLYGYDPDNEFQGVQLYFSDAYTNQLANLSKGQRLSAKCVGDGLILEDVQLDHCALIPNAPAQ